MADEKLPVTFELNLFFNEEGEIVMGGGMHVKLTGDGIPPLWFIADAVKRVEEWGALRRGTEETKARDDTQEPRPVRKAPTPEARGDSGATDAQCRQVLAICHGGVDEDGLLNLFGEEAEFERDDAGNLIPTWVSLKVLSKQAASKLIMQLKKLE